MEVPTINRDVILKEIKSSIKSAKRSAKFENYSEALKHKAVAFAFIRMLEVLDCGSHGGYDPADPMCGRHGFNNLNTAESRFDWLVNKYGSVI